MFNSCPNAILFHMTDCVIEIRKVFKKKSIDICYSSHEIIFTDTDLHFLSACDFENTQ